MRILLGVASLLLVVGLTAAVTSPAQEAAPLLEESFDRPALGPDWKVDVSADNTVTLHDAVVEIRAAENTYAHLERRLEQDHVRATCVLWPGSGVSWCTSLFLYWKPADWCEIGVIPRGGGRYYVCISTGGRRAEYDLTRCRFADWHHVGIELGEDCIRFLSSNDGKMWQAELFVPRPPELTGPPALLIVGKGFGADANHPDLDSDYGTRGEVAVSKIRAVRVTPTAEDRMRITADERRAQELADCDPRGTEILQRAGDPDYETVAAKLPALSKPREVVGVADHPYEIGVGSDGTLQLGGDEDGWQQRGPFAFFELGSPPARFGSADCRKHLLDGYLPIVLAECKVGNLRGELTVLGWSEGMSPDADLWAYARLRIANPEPQDQHTEVALRFQPESETYKPLRRPVDVPAGGSAELCYKLPAPPKSRPAAEVDRQEFQRRLDEARQSWATLLNGGMTIHVPEPRVNDAYRAWLAYNYLNVDKKAGIYEIHDGGGFYEQIYGYSAALFCHALDLWGRHDDARRYLESLLTRVKPDGLIFENYGLPDEGSLLLALCEHYRLTGEADWLRQQAPTMVKMCDWLIHKRQESMRAEPNAKLPVTYGLIKFTPYCDYATQTFDYYGDAYSCTGIENTAQVFGELGLKDESTRLAKEAAAYRADILASLDAAVFEHDGAKLLPMEPDTHRLLKDGKYKGGEYYGLVASMFLEAELLPPADPRVRLVTDALEKRGGLLLGMSEFADGVDHAYTYGYWLNCLRRGEVRRVILGFYGTLAYGMGRDTYCGVEVTQIVTGEPTPTTPHTYSGTQQLRLLRMMLLREEGDELVLGPAIPHGWLKSGQRIEVRDAPTTFGPVSFTVESALDQNRISVQLDPPQRRLPKAIRLGLRHPADRPIKQALLDGKPSDRVTGQTLVLTPQQTPMRIELSY